MPSRAEMYKKNQKKYKKYQTNKNAARIIKNILVALGCIFLVFVLLVVSMNFYWKEKDVTVLSSQGLYDPVEIENSRKINIPTFGNENSKYTVVVISDVGTDDFLIHAKRFLSPLKNNLLVALPNRAGCGYSDDTGSKQSNEQIISDYRAALKNKGLESPYILLADGFGCTYATYWTETFPDEIAGVVYSDGHSIENGINLKEAAKKSNLFNIILCKSGFTRLANTSGVRASNTLLTSEESDCSMIFTLKSLHTNGSSSEYKELENNYKIFDRLNNTKSIPKIYINSKYSFETERDVYEYFRYQNTQNEALNLPLAYDFSVKGKFSNDAKSFINQNLKDRTVTNNFVKTLGSCTVVRIPGSDKIYDQKPDCFTSAIRDFVLYINKDIKTMPTLYKDDKVAEWEAYYKANVE